MISRKIIMFAALLMSAVLSLGLEAMAQAPDDSSVDKSEDFRLERDAKRDSILNLITGAACPEKEVKITKFGAKGDGETDCKPAFDKAMQWAEKNDGAKIIVPEGVYYVCGPIHFVSNVCLEIEENAVIKFTPDPDAYLPVVKTATGGMFLYNYSPFIYGYDLHDVSITGKGTIDGNAATTFSTWANKKDIPHHAVSTDDMLHNEIPVEERVLGDGYYVRPPLVQFFNCRGVTLEGVLLTNSPSWCIHILLSENVICRGLRYNAKLINNDGLNPEYSRNVLIEDVEFCNGDDDVAIKAGRDNDGWRTAIPSESIIIRNCRFWGVHAVSIGSEMSAGVQNVFIENCTVRGYCKRGIYVKTNPNRGGFVRNLYVTNCEFDEVEDLLYITTMYAGQGLDNNHFTDIENIYVDGLRCRKVRSGGLILQGAAEKPVRNVVFRNVEIGEVKNAVSFDEAYGVTLIDCHLGGRASKIPSSNMPKDRVFD